MPDIFVAGTQTCLGATTPAVLECKSGRGPVGRPAIPADSMQRSGAFASCLLVAGIAGACIAASPETAKLDALSPLATQEEIAQRLLSPVQREEFERAMARRNARIRTHTLAVGQETFDLLVPDAPAGSRYGLIVFVPPTDTFALPHGWHGVLRERRLILIAARGAGNDADMLGRRVPLALHAYDHAIRHYPVDAERVYVAGFSGGARTAQMIAFGWPDVFRGVLQFAGSDTFGETAVPPPRAPSMELVRQRLRIVHATGSADAANLAIDVRTRRSLATLCVTNVSQAEQPRLGHVLPEARGLAKALDALLQPGVARPDDACDRSLRARIEADLQAVDRLLQMGDTTRARKRLGELDRHYGWLAAPRSAALARRLLDASAPAAQ